MTITYTRMGSGHPGIPCSAASWTVAEAVETSLRDDVQTYGDDDHHALLRRLDAQAAAIGQLAQLLVEIAPACAAENVQRALVELVSSRFVEVQP
jgi:hypothetical protein